MFFRSSRQPLFAAETYTADRFESVNGKRNPYEELKHSESKRNLYRTAITRLVKALTTP